MNRWILLALTASLGLSACTKDEEGAAPTAAAPADQAAAPAAPAAPAQAAANTGTVMQTMVGGGYTYAQVDVGGGQSVWIAGAQIDVKPGDSVQWGDAMVMQNFHSKAIDRVFDEILFVSAWGPAGGSMAQVAPHGEQGGASAGGGHPPMGQAGMGQAPAGGGVEHVGQVKSVTTAAGYSYLEVAQGDTTVWVAVPEVAAKAGDKVSWNGGMVMQNFTAKSINRTFPEIIFADAARVVQ